MHSACFCIWEIWPQVTAPVKKRGAVINHSFSEPDLARLVVGGARGSPRRANHHHQESPRKRRGGILPWGRYVKNSNKGQNILWKFSFFSDWSSVLRVGKLGRSFPRVAVRCLSSWKTTLRNLKSKTHIILFIILKNPPQLALMMSIPK